MKQISNNVSLDIENGYIIAKEKKIALTKRETQIAECLFENPVPVKDICKKYELTEINVRVIIHRIRSKIEDVIKTKFSFGYYVD